MNKYVLFVFFLLASIRVSAQPATEGYVYFTKGQWATIILPIAPDTDKGIYYKLDRYENNQIIFVEEPRPQARTPYIIVPKEDFYIDLSTLDLEGYILGKTAINGISFIGYCYSDYVGCKDGYYYIIIDNTPDCYKGDNLDYPIIGALRAYIEVDWRVFPGEKIEEVILMTNTTSMRLLPVKTQNKAERIYDLQGRRLSSEPSKGIYIQNGRKHIGR